MIPQNSNTKKACQQVRRPPLFDPPPDFLSCPLADCLDLLDAGLLEGWEEFFVWERADLSGEELTDWEFEQLKEIAVRHGQGGVK